MANYFPTKVELVFVFWWFPRTLKYLNSVHVSVLVKVLSHRDLSVLFLEVCCWLQCFDGSSKTVTCILLRYSWYWRKPKFLYFYAFWFFKGFRYEAQNSTSETTSIELLSKLVFLKYRLSFNEISKVKVNMCTSCLQFISSRVPQGSILGHSFYVLAIYQHCFSSSALLFADV